MASQFETELQKLVQEYETAQKQSKYNDCSDAISDVKVRQLQTRCLAGTVAAIHEPL